MGKIVHLKPKPRSTGVKWAIAPFTGLGGHFDQADTWEPNHYAHASRTHRPLASRA